MTKNIWYRTLSLALAVSLTPLPLAVSMAQSSQGNSQAQSPEEKKLLDAQEKERKREEERKAKEAKTRAKETKTYNTLREFAEDQYASDPEFRDDVDEAYLDLQSRHAQEAYVINTTHPKEYIATENEGDPLKIRRALYDNPAVADYVNRLGQRLVPSDSEKLYAFKVMVGPIPTAYTLSTGTILVSSGMVSLVDNEAQLAYVLAHEMAHVYKDHWKLKVMMPLAEEEYNRRQEKRRQRFSWIATAIGAGIGAAAKGGEGAAIGAGIGMLAGYAIASTFAKKMAVDWYEAQENEADDFALKAVLNNSFDAQEVPKLFATLGQVAHKDLRMQLGFLGNRRRIGERTAYANRALQGPLQGQYQQLLKAGTLVGASSDFNLVMAELKRDNGIEAFYFDMFSMARRNLEQASALRSDDPLAAYYYARLLKQVGRTKEELAQAQQLIQTAIRLDVRQSIPEIQLHKALLLMLESKEPSLQPEAVQSLKQYILAYQRKRVEVRDTDWTLPSNVDVLYDYMRLLGEKSWKPPTAVLVSQQANVQPATTQPQANQESRPVPIAAPSPSPVKTRPPTRKP